jgi:hypothetical protein
VSAAPAAVCEDGLVSIEGGSQHAARCVPIQAFRQVSVKEDNEEANVIEPRGGESLLPLNKRLPYFGKV